MGAASGSGGDGGDSQKLLARAAAEEERVEQGGGKARQARQTRLGRLNARERIAALVDDGSFLEMSRYVAHQHASRSELLANNQHPGDGLICGLARVDGRPIAVYAHDPTVLRGALGHAASLKLCRLMDVAGEKRIPLVAFADCDGVRIDEGTFAIEAYGDVIRRTIALRSEIAQLTLVSGLCVGAAAYNAVLTDFVGMVKEQSFMFITGAKVTQAMTGEVVDIADLGGSEMHATKTGSCHARVDDEREGIAWVRRMLGYLSLLEACEEPVDAEVPALASIIPTDPRRGYDMGKVIDGLVDRDSATELSSEYGRSLLTVLARLGGRSVAIVASQPRHRAGCLDIESSRKGAHFVRWAARRGMPVITLVDVPGYLPGLTQETGGILPFGAELLEAYGTATTPQISVVIRKSYGGANVLSFHAHYRLALPTAEVAPMGAEAATQVAFPPMPSAGSDAELAEAKAVRMKFRDDWRALYGDVWTAAREGYFDRVVAAAELRRELWRALDHLAG